MLTGREGTVDKDTGLIVRDVGRLVGEAGLLAVPTDVGRLVGEAGLILAVPADEILFLADVADDVELIVATLAGGLDCVTCLF